ncbi:MAG: hypothetical protein H6585_10230 [Flavobacteriales bacterium]|nr:hypothetical protein [Flavobacteriales bacterium]
MFYVRFCKKLPPQRGYCMFLNRKNTARINITSPACLPKIEKQRQETRMAVERERERERVKNCALNTHPVTCLTHKKKDRMKEQNRNIHFFFFQELFCFIFILSLQFNSFAQTGPGGVGDATNNKLWLKADYLSQGDGTAVTSWTDASGNGFDFAQATGSKQPTYKTNILNGQPVVRFDGGDALNSTTITSNAGDHTVFGVLNSTSNTYTFDNTDGARWLTAIHTSGAYWDGAWKGTAIATGATVKIHSWVLDDAGAEVFTDGTSYTTGTWDATSKMGGTQVLGARQDQSTQMMTGDMGEWIVYEGALNTAQRIIVENYLASKYGITIANDKYAHQGTHKEDVAGIGYEDASNFHTAAQSAGILKISNAASLDVAGDYLLFGHDDGDATTWTTAEDPNSGSNSQRLAREWRLDESGTVGSITVGVLVSALPALPGGYTNYVIWKDADGDFTAGATQYPLTQNGSYYETTGLTFTDGDYIAIGCIKPVIQFTLTSSSGSEATTPATIEVSLNYALGSNATVDYTINGASTATGGGTDYTLAAGTATITSGSTTTNISATIVDDGTQESSETIILDLSNPSAGITLGANTQHTYSINDNDGTRDIDFTVASSNGAENVTPVVLTLQITNGASSGTQTVDYTVSGTATGGGTDYTLASGTATIVAPATTTTISIIVVDDALDEAGETVVVSLSNPSAGVNIGTNDVYTYTINDDDASPTVQFTTTSSSGSEGTTPANLELSLSAVSGQDVTVDYNVTGGTATGGGTDYTLASGTATITAGSTTTNISPVIVDDGSVELTETIQVTISNPGNATLGANTTHTFNILDNDDVGFVGPGGVGKSTNNKLWLKADYLSQGDGTAVTSWTDASGNGFDFAQATGSKQPTYKTNILNGQPVVRFDGGDALNSTTITSNAGDHTVFGVLNSTSNTYTFDNTDGARWLTAIHTSGAYWDGAWKGTAIATGATVKIHSWVLDDAGAEVFTDGTSYTTGTWDATSKMGGTQVLGARQDQSTQMMTGDMGEWIVYEGALNTAQRIIVENYLASKYGITIANDKYAHQGTHKEDVAGIGYEDASNFHTAAQSAGILKISNAASLDVAGDYLLFGHDDGDATTWTTAEDPNSGSNSQRLAREWRLDESGTVGSITVGVLVSALPALPGGYTNYVIWKDADGDFTAGATQYPLTQNGSYYETTGLTFTDGDYIAIGCIKPVIQFTLTSSSGSEATTPATIEVSLNYALGSNATVDYTINGASTATGGGTDYTLAAGTATITSGSTTTNISATIVDDGTQESSETIILDLSNPSAGITLGANTQHTYSINDNDGTRDIDFTVASSNGAENVTPVVLTLQITNGASSGTQTVDYTVSGTATGGGTDYTLASGTATIVAPATTTTISIIVVDDALDEAGETVVVSLSNPSAGVNIGTNDVYTYTINDDDASPTVQFTTTSSSGSEGTTPANLELSLSAVSGQDVTVDYNVTGGTATGGGTDYTLASGTATITAGSTTTNISPVIVDDGSVELTETIQVTISNPGNATLGANTTHTFNILDNDDVGFVGPGGVGKSTNNKLWLKADYLSQGDGTAVTSWTDASGNGFDFAQATGSKQPTYKTNILNGQPVVRFDGGDALNSTTITSNAGDHTVFGVLNSTSNTYTFDNTDGARWLTAIHTSGAYWDGAWKGTAIATGATVKIHSWVLDDAGAEVFTDGTSYTTGTWDATSKMGGTQVLGARQDQSTQMMTGDMGEWIVYEGALNTAQRIIVENYLASKYGITIANDKYAHQGTHKEDVAGIGYEDASNFHTAAQSAGILKISNATSLDVAGDYLLFGHDDGDATTWTTAEIPGNITNIQRIAREWRVDITGTLGSVSMSIDPAGLPGLPANYHTYAILVDANGNFSTGASFYPMTFSGGNWEVSGINITDNDYISVAIVHNVSVQSGNLNTASTWAANVAPSSGEDVIISGGYTVSLTADFSVGSVDFLSGKINLSGSNLTIASTGTITGYNATNYIQADGAGELKKSWTAIGSFTYPVGDASNYSPFTITFNAGTGFAGADLAVRVVDAIHPNEDKSDHITRYWVVTPTGISTPDFDLSYIYVDADIVGTEANMFARKWSAGSWTDYDAVNAPANTLTGSNITSFSNFGGGGGAPLPIELLYFDAKLIGDVVQLNWSTATETNNDFFTIEKSQNGMAFEKVTTVDGAGNSSSIQNYSAIDENPYKGISYYRLKQTDFDGKYEYSDLVAVQYVKEADVRIFPNPLDGSTFYLSMNGSEGQEVLVVLYNPLGSEVYSMAIVQQEGPMLRVIDLKNKLSPGIYLIIGSSRNELFRQKLIIR